MLALGRSVAALGACAARRRLAPARLDGARLLVSATGPRLKDIAGGMSHGPKPVRKVKEKKESGLTPEQRALRRQEKAEREEKKKATRERQLEIQKKRNEKEREKAEKHAAKMAKIKKHPVANDDD